MKVYGSELLRLRARHPLLGAYKFFCVIFCWKPTPDDFCGSMMRDGFNDFIHRHIAIALNLVAMIRIVLNVAHRAKKGACLGLWDRHLSCWIWLLASQLQAAPTGARFSPLSRFDLGCSCAAGS